uniref:PPM-type phosphatase domain-containing protein n=1 Tax=Amphora coffeiformis TaxID=265554 RepID=A0A7S3L068_9STRA|mmetsp:Transcript_3998/g.7985  ORF Transcript_3998/g.7985 Transcript_3998/m.7985 type:complete len:537 (-) Transcript_3998:39-1649(-)
MPADDSNSDVLPPMNSAEKSATFRKRRLSCPKHHLEQAVAAAQEEEESHEDSKEQRVEEEGEDDSNDKAHTFRKRRLSLTLSKPQDDSEEGQRPAQRRRSSVASTASAASSTGNQPPLKRHKSLTLHSTELLGGPLPPPSPAVHNNDLLYRQQPAPPPALALGPPGLEAVEHLPKHEQRRLLNPKWKKRHQPTDESKFPFPKDIVGTYSCHGVEPIYESDYDSPDNESGEDDSPLETPNNDGTIELSQQDVVPTKVTMAAKINQDRGGIAYPYGNSRQTALFAVYDGHGQGGELVSQYALHEIQRRLERHPTFKSDLERAFRETFVAVDDSLRHEPIIDPYYAGTTAVVALLRDQKLTLANAGDSRAVLAQRTGDSWTALDLTQDQNPDSPGEQARIESMGGYVSAPPAPGLSSRVWLDSDLTQIGLAMARSIGDHAIGEVGVIADPVVTERVLEPQDDFMILASDGVWEFLSSQDAVNIVGEHLEERGSTKACQALIEAAAARWHDEEGEYRDDITAIVVRLPGLWDKLASSSKS